MQERVVNTKEGQVLNKKCMKHPQERRNAGLAMRHKIECYILNDDSREEGSGV